MFCGYHFKLSLEHSAKREAKNGKTEQQQNKAGVGSVYGNGYDDDDDEQDERNGF